MTNRPFTSTTRVSSSAGTKPMSPLLRRAMQLWARLHVGIYRLTRGTVGGMMPGPTNVRNPVLLLTTTGRRSGRERITPLLYLAEGDDLVVVASGQGPDGTTDWLRNVLADPRVRVQVRGEEVAVRAALASPDERARLWPKLVAMFSRWGAMQELTSREVPVIILRPLQERGAKSALRALANADRSMTTWIGTK